MALIDATEPAAVEYDRLAPYYDAFTAGYAYERWVSELERHALALGLSGQRALDLACGTGKRSEEHTSELQSRLHLVCRLLLEKKKERKDFTAIGSAVGIIQYDM